MHITEKHIEIRAPIERVFDLFSDFESFPRWMKNIREVRYTGRRFTRWAAEAPLGTEVEWEAETTGFEPDRRIAWRSVRGDVETEGEVIFEEIGRDTTLMSVVLGYALPAGRLGEMVARLFGKDPEQQLEDDLQRFAAVAEGRPRGSLRGGREYDERERMDGRRPQGRMIGPGERRAWAAGADDRDERPSERRAAARERRERDYYTAGPEQRDEEERPAGRRDGAGFEEALRAARRSQLEGRRRYATEREQRDRGRDQGRRYAGERERALAPRRLDEEREDRRAWEIERRKRDESREEDRRRELAERDDLARRPRRRYALTPREREREMERGRDPDFGYSDEAFRRGVDKLMDEPPSRRWRRWE